jgi:hypothetical protein
LSVTYAYFAQLALFLHGGFTYINFTVRPSVRHENSFLFSSFVFHLLRKASLLMLDEHYAAVETWRAYPNLWISA